MSEIIYSAKYVGVYWETDRERWRATIEVGCSRFRCGRHRTEEDAARAYDLMAIRLGVPERCNFAWERNPVPVPEKKIKGSERKNYKKKANGKNIH